MLQDILEDELFDDKESADMINDTYSSDIED
jgi:hypothetical protein